MQLTIHSPWTGDGKTPATAYTPLVAVQYQLTSYGLVSAVDPGHSAPVMVAVTATPAVIALIASDTTYSGGSVTTTVSP